MKIALLISLFAYTHHTISAQNISAKQAKKYSKEVIGIIKKNSIYTDSLDYEAIESDFIKHIDTFTSNEKIGLYYTKLLHKAGDNHSFYVTAKTISDFSTKQKENLNFSYKLLEGNIGYLSVPGFLSTDNAVINDFANQIHNAITELDSKNVVSGWIVDLRKNAGGNMWPMVLGLNPLIGSEVAGYFKKANGTEAWKTSSPLFGITIKAPYIVKKIDAKIAILYGGKTASSGEMTAICFIGKPNTKSFGTETGGYTSANQIFNLSDGNMFILASSHAMDRNKNLYSGKIKPDVSFENPTEETVLNAAINWIKESK